VRKTAYRQLAEIFLQRTDRVGSAANRCLPTPINSQPVTVRGDALECAINSLSLRKLAMPSHFIRRLSDVSRASDSPLEIWNVDCDFLSAIQGSYSARHGLAESLP